LGGSGECEAEELKSPPFAQDDHPRQEIVIFNNNNTRICQQMKPLTIFFIAFFIISNKLHAQGTTDKQAFANAFIKVFEQRSTAFDSLRTKDWENTNGTTVKMPGSAESYISDNMIYGALYRGSDSLKMLGFYKEMKEWLAYTASFYKATVKYSQVVPGDPHYETFYFSDSTMFTCEGSNISFSKSFNGNHNNDDDEEEEDKNKSVARKDSFEVLLLIRPGNTVSYYTSAGEKLEDAGVKQIISQIAFGKDPWLNSIKTNKKVQKDANYYNSKLNLKGFTAVIREAANTKKAYLSTTLTKIYNTEEKKFMRSGDSLAIKIKTAMPAGYCYQVTNEEEHVNIEFKPVPFFKEVKNAPDVNLNYYRVADKQNTFKLELVIGRSIVK